jgi:FG-GAP repeat
MQRYRFVSVVTLVILALLPLSLTGSASARTAPDTNRGIRGSDTLSTGLRLHAGGKRDALAAATGSTSVTTVGGSVSVMGDFDHNGRNDLAIGVPSEDLAGAGAGAVEVLYGRSGGLSAASSQIWKQGDLSLTDEAGDAFGSSLAAGDFNNDGFTDLAVGIPGEDVAATDEGALAIIYGSGGGLTSAGTEFLTQDVISSTDGAENDDGFAQSLAAGSFGDGAADDLAIGISGEDVGVLTNAGAVTVVYGSGGGLSGADNQTWTQDSSLVEGIAETGDLFGFSLAAADFGQSKQDDLAIGAVEESVGEAIDAGAVNVLYGSSSGLLPFGDQIWTQDSEGVKGTAEEIDLFGYSLAAANFGKSGKADLAIGVLFQDVGSAFFAGAVNVLYGSSSGLTAGGNQLWTQNSPGIADKSEAVDEFGLSLAAGNLGKSAQADLAIGVPVEGVGGSSGAGAVNVIYGSTKGLVSKGNQLWTQNSSGVKDAAEANDVFGSSLLAVNFGKTSHADLAIGVPSEDVGVVADAGAVSVLYGTTNGLTSTGNQLWTQNNTGAGDTAETGDSFGSALG